MMMRKLVVFLAAAVLLMPLGAQALGFGKVIVHSALDEPLDADIELISPTPEDITNLKIKLASPEAYMRAGIDRPYILGDLHFAIRQDDKGRYYIHVSSKKPIKEPFLDFLLEMNWQNGRMVREYTILLDPPDRIQRQPAMVEAPATQEAPAAATKPVPAPAPAPAPAAESAPVSAPVAEAPAEAPAPAATEEPFPRTEMTEAEIPPAPPVNESEPAPAPAAEKPAAPAPAPAPAPEPMAMNGEPVPAPAAEAEAEAPALAEQEEELFPRIPLAELGEAARSARSGSAEAPSPVTGELDYGIVQKGDTLWKIAEKLRPNDQVSIYQVMMALLVSNPDAFVDGNMNRLKVGHVLRIDDPEIITSVNPQEAAREYRAQLQAWQDYRQSVAASEPEVTQPVIAGEAAQGETGAEAPSGELTLASPDGGELQAGTGTSEEAARNELLTLREELRQLREDSAAMGTHNEALNRELAALETEIENKQRALSISDDELAALQQQLASAREAAAASKPPAEEPAQAETAPAEEAPQAGMATPPAPAENAPAGESATPAGQAEMAQPEPAAGEGEQGAGEGEQGAGEGEQGAGEQVAMAEPPAKSPVELADEIAKREQQPGASPAAPMTPPAGDQGGIMNTIMGVLAGIGAGLQGAFGGMAGDSLLMFVGLPVLLVLLLIAAIVIRRRRSAENYQESILTGEPAAAAGGAPAGAAAGPESEEESSFLSDFAVSGAGAIQTEDSEVDPLTEADVFVAYGRYEAAEERLKEAIENDPDRAELKLKLLELYHTTKNKPAFENAAEEFYASLGDNAAENPMWQKVVAMGAELVPNNPLFSNAGSEAVVEAAASVAPSETSSASLSESQVMDIGLDTGVFDVADLGAPEPKPEAPAETKPAEPEASPMDSGVMDFNIDMEPPAAGKTSEPETSAASAEGGLDFSLDLGESDSATTEPDLVQPETGDAGLDFSLDTGPTTEAPAETAGEESALDFNLDVDEAPTAQMTTEAAAEAGLDFSLGEEKKDDSGALDFDLDLGTSAPAGDEDETAEMSLNLSAPAEESSSDTSMALDISEDSTATMPEPSGMDFELDATDASLDIGTGDEVGTKLDLAKAYIDMGDPDGARSILDEVLDEGNEAQKQEAQQLLQQIA